MQREEKLVERERTTVAMEIGEQVRSWLDTVYGWQLPATSILAPRHNIILASKIIYSVHLHVALSNPLFGRRSRGSR